jgi:hypothetical protein
MRLGSLRDLCIHLRYGSPHAFGNLAHVPTRCVQFAVAQLSLGVFRRTVALTHDEAPGVVRPIVDKWNAAYYVRGSYQVLAIDLEVGWHPEYRALLTEDM